MSFPFSAGHARRPCLTIASTGTAADNIRNAAAEEPHQAVNGIERAVFLTRCASG